MSRIHACEFFDNHQLTILESILVQSCSKECIFSLNEKDVQYNQLIDIITRCNISKTQISNFHYFISEYLIVYQKRVSIQQFKWKMFKKLFKRNMQIMVNLNEIL